MTDGDHRIPWLRVRPGAALVALGLLAGTSTLDAGSGDGAIRHPLARAEVRCASSVRHPIDVRVRPLDPVRRGTTVRLEVLTSARIPLGNAEIQLVSPGGAALTSAPRLALGRLAPEREATGTFLLAVPQQGHRFLVQFVVRGEGAAGPLARGAVYNLLPDGPLDPGRAVTTPDGTSILEFAATRSGR